MEPVPQMLAETWAHAMPGRESVAQNELLRTLRALLTADERPIRLPPRLRLVHPD